MKPSVIDRKSGDCIIIKTILTLCFAKVTVMVIKLAMSKFKVSVQEKS